MFKSAIAGGMLLIGTLLPAAMASAAPMSPQPPSVADVSASLIEKAQWGYCRYWRHTCAQRWGWGDYGFRRCLWRHGC
jgi:hypothetical protein